MMRSLYAGDRQADRVVPPSGFTAQLTLFAAGATAFLAVFALALSLASGRLATRWGDELARSATIRIVAPLDQRTAQKDAALRILETTKGVAKARALSDEEQQALLAPWFGAELAIDELPVPRLIEVIEDSEGMDPAGEKGWNPRRPANFPGQIQIRSAHLAISRDIRDQSRRTVQPREHRSQAFQVQVGRFRPT